MISLCRLSRDINGRSNGSYISLCGGPSCRRSREIFICRTQLFKGMRMTIRVGTVSGALTTQTKWKGNLTKHLMIFNTQKKALKSLTRLSVVLYMCRHSVQCSFWRNAYAERKEDEITKVIASRISSRIGAACNVEKPSRTSKEKYVSSSCSWGHIANGRMGIWKV